MTLEELQKKIEELEEQNKKLSQNSGIEEKLKAEQERAKKAQEEADRKERELLEFKKQIEEKSRLELEGKNDFKGLYQKTVKELEDMRETARIQKEKAIEEKKYQMLSNKLRELGVKERYQERVLKLANIKAVGVDESSGLFYGQELEAERVKSEFPDLFGEKKELPGGAKIEKKDTLTGGKLTLEEWKKLPYDERKKREQELFE